MLTTRNDGKITIDIPPLGNYTVYISTKITPAPTNLLRSVFER